MKVIWSPLAIEKVSEIAEYIAKDNTEASARWVDAVFRKVKRLEKFPRSGRKVPEAGRADIMEIIYGNYRIIYRVSQKEVSILSVRHNKQNLPRKDVFK